MGWRRVALGFVNLYCPDSQERVYDSTGRWRNEHYYTSGRLTGWTRIRGKERQEFTADGGRVVARDAQGSVKRFVFASSNHVRLKIVENLDTEGPRIRK
jgi:hypothetical protein